MNVTVTDTPFIASVTASGAIERTEVLRFEVVLNGGFGDHLSERPVDFAAALAGYPQNPSTIDEPDWSLGGTPLGV